MSIQLDDVQSIVLRGYRVLEALPFQRYAYLRFASREAGRAWLKRVLPKVTSLAVFDAQNVADGPIACAELPHRVPYGFHGNWKYND